ncbi:uncharacterized protein LOC143284787 [Babylonia areolata]|uniref:uncharacterized protein LOC143284787 n=1 Tax=Babylonia areolata TaxID=304850 RepID=UPI003FD12A1A
MSLPDSDSILERFDLDLAVDRVHENQGLEPPWTSKSPAELLRLWLALLPGEVTSRLELALHQTIPFMPPDFTPEVLATANHEVPSLTHVDVLCVCIHFAMQCDFSVTAALIFTVDRALYRFGRSKPLLRIVADLRRVSPGTALAPQVTLRRARVLKDQGDLNGALRVIHTIISREDGWQYRDDRQYQDTKAACLHVQGQIYHNLELWHCAIPPLVEGFRIFNHVQDRKGIGSILHVLSRCLCRLQQQQYDVFRKSHPDLFEEADPCYEGYRQGQAAVYNVQHTYDSFFVVKHQLVADESLLMFAVQNRCPIHFQRHLQQIVGEIRGSLGGYRSVASLQNVESFVEFVRAVHLASLVLFHSWAPADRQHAGRLESLSLKLYTAMCCGGYRERTQPPPAQQTALPSDSFTHTAQSVELLNKALALLGLSKLQWTDKDDDHGEDGDDRSTPSSEMFLKTVSSDSSHVHADLDNQVPHVRTPQSLHHEDTNLGHVTQASTGDEGGESNGSVSGSKEASSTDGQTSSSHGQTSSSLGQTSSSHGQTSSSQTSSSHGQTSSSQTSSSHGQTSSGHGQTSSSHGHTSSSHGQTSSVALTGSDQKNSKDVAAEQSHSNTFLTPQQRGSNDLKSNNSPSHMLTPAHSSSNPDISDAYAAQRHDDMSRVTIYSQTEDLQEEELHQKDSCHLSNSSTGFCPEQTILIISGDGPREGNTSISTPVSPLATPDEANSANPTGQECGHDVEDIVDHSQPKGPHCNTKRMSTRTSAAYNTHPELVKAFPVEPMPTSAEGEPEQRGVTVSPSGEPEQRGVTVESSARASTFPAVSSSKQRGGRRRVGSQVKERYVGLALSREELRAATWPALAPEAESSLQDQDSAEDEEDDDLDALSISVSTSASSSASFSASSSASFSASSSGSANLFGMFKKEAANSAYDTANSVSTDSDASNDNGQAWKPPFDVHGLQALTPLHTEENVHRTTRHACLSCSQPTSGCSTVDQNASTKSSTPLTPDISTCSSSPQSHENTEDIQKCESDSLLSGLLQHHHIQQQAEDSTCTWQPPQQEQVHRAVVLTFNVWTGRWHQQSSLIHVGDALPLTDASPHGASRDAFLVSFLHQGEPLARYVGKKYRKQRKPQEYMRDVTDQMMASYYVTLFNEALGSQHSDSLTIHFLPAVHLQVVNEKGEVVDWLNVEPYMDGRYDKITNNASYLASHRPHLATGTQVATAFSHFSYVCSQGRFMVVDLQGCVPDDNKGVIYLTDPVLHSVGRLRARSSPFDRHEQGMADFFQCVHPKCNAICRLLQLEQYRPSSGDLVG